MGYATTRRQGIDNGISGTTNADLAGRPVEDRRRARPGSAAPTTRAPTRLSSAPATRRRGTATCARATTCTRRRRVAIDVTTGQIKWHYQTTPHDGWDFDGVNEFVTFDRRAASGSARQGRPQRLLLRARPRPTASCENAFPFVNKITWATGIDLKTGRPIFVPEEPAGRPDQGRRRQEGRGGVLGAVLPGRQELDADGLQPEDRPVLRARQRMGHGHLERADHLQEGRGLPGRGLHHQAAL